MNTPSPKYELLSDFEGWSQAFTAAVDAAIEHLQVLIFDESWDEIRASAASDEDALRESVLHYERGLEQIFGFVRASGAPADAVAWSEMKAAHRRAAREAEVEITLRTALENGMYAAEQVTLGDHAAYRQLGLALMRFLSSLSADAPVYPGPRAGEEERLGWAYELLRPLEDHGAFHAAFVHYLSDPTAAGEHRAQVIALQERLLTLPRYDILLNAALLWLADTGGFARAF